ncbi:centrosomal protein of 152 kDa isoform X2 [Ascaphus truei]|uniref:centrosomal protein of 152 kDa isoform X2 n=1 Tax=Ascaphus truei TaxID=8439 RepID=UPI003F5A2032
MSIDFDSGALQTQHEDDEEYDKEDYAREQELQQLLTDLPHDMLDDSLSSSPEPNYSDCSGQEICEPNQPWDHGTSWGDAEGMPNCEKGYKNGYTENHYHEEYVSKPGEILRTQGGGDEMSNGWGTLHSNEEENMFDGKYSYPKEQAHHESNGEAFHNGEGYDAPGHCSSSELYHLPEDFQPYTNGHQQIESYPDAKREHFQRFIASEGTSNQPVESIQVKYNPYQLNVAHKNLVNQDTAKRGDHFDEMQREFLDTGESSSNSMQFVQLQVLYKARGRQLDGLNDKFEDSGRQIRYLNHQLAIVKDEKDGLAISLQESHTLFQNAREREIQLEGQMKALEKTVECLTTNEEHLRKELKVAKVAMESMQQQVLDLRRSDSIQRAREQHEAIVSVLKKKSEEQVLALQQKLDEVHSALLEQKELCCRLEDQVKRAERNQEESKLEKTEIINRLTRSLEECQKQCANLLHTGSIQEATGLRLQLQQVLSSKNISDGMNKALQEEVTELKEHITLYESAAKMGVFINNGEQEDLSDSYVDLGIKKVNWQKTRFQRAMRNKDIRKDLSTEEIAIELKAELERSLNSNKTKRHQIVQLQTDLKGYRSKTEELEKLLEKAEKTARGFEQKDPVSPYGHAPSETLKEDIQKLKSDKDMLQQEVEKHLMCIKKLEANEEKLRAANQELCNEMRGMVQDFDNDKQDAVERCERTYEKHHEDIRNSLRMELSEKFSSEKEQLCQTYEENISQLQSRMNEMSHELTAVQECYIAVCKEKDTLEDSLRENLKKELQINEQKFKDNLLKETDETLQTLKAELEDKQQSALSQAKVQWLKEKEAELKEQIQVQVALSRESWRNEQLKITEKTVQDIEKEWTQKLDKVVQDAKIKARQDFEEHAVQTDQTLTKTAFDIEQIDELKFQLQDALQEKERAAREARLGLEIQHNEDISKQVELAVTKAHVRWLQELTSLSEYKAHLKLAQEKWEKINELNVKKQISDALAAAEEDWKKRAGKADFNVNQKELEEKIASMSRELDMKNEEFQARLKVEQAKARAQWNKEKQEEIHKIQAQNEKDYRLFLDEHRSKIGDVLSTAKGDFEKQKCELLSQKEAEIRAQLNHSLKQWASQESQRVQQRENEILSDVEQFLDDLHNEVIDKCVVKDRLSSVQSSLDVQFLEKLRACLQKAIKGIIYEVLTKAKEEWKRKCDESKVNPQIHVAEGEPETRASCATSRENGQKMTEIHLESNDPNFKGKDGSHGYSCCEHCLQHLEKSKKQCHELRSRLEKVCRHLQQTVKEQKLSAEHLRENETAAETLRKENVELHNKLEEMKATITASFQPQEGYENALEEMRAQYIKAVDKIKNDMLRYIHESKVRAAEMLKSEVLRERQETARKMRKYYLTCLQQLLKDDGKNEGAEKKIMNAASKLATMAKVLETPISQKSQTSPLSKAVLPETEQDKSDSLKTVPSWASNRSKDQNIDQMTIDQFMKRRVPINFKDQPEGSKIPDTAALTIGVKSSDCASMQFRKDLLKQESLRCPDVRHSQTQVLHSMNSQCVMHTPEEQIHSFGCIDSNADSVHVKLRGQAEPSFLQGIKGCHRERPKITSDSQRFDLQETPVRDENGSNDRSAFSGKNVFSSQPGQCSFTNLHIQPQVSITSENFATAGVCSVVEGSRDLFGSDCEVQNYSAHIAKRKNLNRDTEHSNKILELPPPTTRLNPDSKPYSSSTRPSRKLLLELTSLQQDSGFDSPFLNFNNFN